MADNSSNTVLLIVLLLIFGVGAAYFLTHQESSKASVEIKVPGAGALGAQVK